MSESPSPSNANRFSSTLAWSVIIVSVCFITWDANSPRHKVEATPAEQKEGLISGAEANELAMLKMQGRIFIGMAQLSPAQISDSVDQLADIPKTTRGKVAIAILNAFIDKKDGVKNGVALLGDIDSSDDNQFKEKIKGAIENGVSDTEREEFKKQIGWFSGLLPAAEGSTADELHSSIKKDAFKASMIYLAFAICAFFAGLTGLTLLILAIVFYRNGSFKFRYIPGVAANKSHLYIESFAIYIGIMALGHFVPPDYEILSKVFFVLSILLAVFWPLIRGSGWNESRNLMGLNRGTGFFREVGAGILGYFVLLVFACLGLILTLILIQIVSLIREESLGVADASHPIIGMLGGAHSFWAKFALLFLAAGLAPLFEETMFRGALYRHLRHRWGILLSALAGGVIFAIVHPQGIFALPALAAMGFGFALIREWRDSLIASMTAHALNNGFLVSFIILVMG